MVCDRYELRDDVMPGAGRFRGGIGVVKKQRILTDGFITHECDRHEDVPWGIFGGGEGQCGAVEVYNAARPDDVTDMPAKFAGLRVSEGDVMALNVSATTGASTSSVTTATAAASRSRPS